MVIVTSRVHPGETNASWMLMGLLDFLCSDHFEVCVGLESLSSLTLSIAMILGSLSLSAGFTLSRSVQARSLRQRVVFKIVPVLNPDGGKASRSMEMNVHSPQSLSATIAAHSLAWT